MIIQIIIWLNIDYSYRSLEVRSTNNHDGRELLDCRERNLVKTQEVQDKLQDFVRRQYESDFLTFLQVYQFNQHQISNHNYNRLIRMYGGIYYKNFNSIEEYTVFLGEIE